MFPDRESVLKYVAAVLRIAPDELRVTPGGAVVISTGFYLQYDADGQALLIDEYDNGDDGT